jgi:hypothetical protein
MFCLQNRGFRAILRDISCGTQVSSAELATKIAVAVGTGREYPGPKVRLRKGAPPIPAQRCVTITFRARVAVNARSFYTINTHMQHARRSCTYGASGPIAQDETAGTPISQTLYVPYRCRGTLKINVGYTQQRRPAPMPFDVGGFRNAKVGRATVKLP